MKQTDFDVAVIGAGLGGLTAGAILAKNGRKVCVIEKSMSLGGAASTYKAGALTIEAALHQTANPSNSADPKHQVLKRLGLLDALEWVPVGPLYCAEGGPLGDEPFVLGDSFESVRTSMSARFSSNAARVVDDMEEVFGAVSDMTAAREPPSVVKLLRALAGLGPVVTGWNKSLAQVLERDLGGDEGAKCAIAGNLPYYGNDPSRLWWLYYAIAQGGYIAAGGTFVKGGSMRLAVKLARVIREAGGDVLRGRRVTSVVPPADGKPAVVVHQGKQDEGSERLSARAVAANCAPHALAAMLQETDAVRLMERYEGMPLSLSMYSIHYGIRGSEAHILPRFYSTMMLPPWMTRLSDYSSAAAMLGEAPAGRIPPIGIANHGAIDGGLDNRDLVLVSVVAVDTIENWTRLDKAREHERREAWADAITEKLEERWPGFAAAVEQRVILNARSIRDYLGAPDGAIYGFAMEPPARPIWFGLKQSPKTSLDGVFLASAFAGGGGYSGVMRSGATAGDVIEHWLQRRADR